ncbi:MAG: PP0621 family protein [Arcobacteraceae bacterium]|jgi:uncharacterized protein
MIFKIALFVLALVGIYFLFFKKSREKEVNTTRKKQLENEEIMVECPTCKVFVSKKESILNNAQYYCSKECLR